MGFLGSAVQGFGSTYRKKQNPQKTPAAIPASYGGTGPETGDSYKRGGKVRRTGLARVHRGERVLTAKQAKRYRRGRSKRR